MRSNRSLNPGCDGLEARRLLTHHSATAAQIQAMVVTPLFLNGTLTVNDAAAKGSVDALGNLTTMVPVHGTLASVGPVQGSWVETQNDSVGGIVSPDSLQLHNAQGSFAVIFNNPLVSTSGSLKLAKSAHHAATPIVATGPQHVHGGTKADAHAVETGSISLTTNSADKTVVSITLDSNAL